MTAAATSLLGRVAAGDGGAVEECLSQYGPLVWSIARRLGANPSDAEDAVQEVFVELWRVAGRFDAAIASEATFIATIARRRLIDRRRRQQRQPATGGWADYEPAAPAASPVDWLQICDEAALARRKMRELSADQQRVLSLAIEDGCTQSEIADRLDLPLGTVKAHARRGLIRLRELMSAESSRTPAAGGAR
ncbi:MAG TPA: sigma-70 family RNA polymerase sigma factor [Lacipirellulaceae bacterium]|nr:sigma-70 family RNA polymerase sigma factor [Lacipirellulaceae bacterium]